MKDNRKFLIHILNGGMVEGYRRYYTIGDNVIMYSDNMKNWKVSNMTINDFLSFNDWDIVE